MCRAVLTHVLKPAGLFCLVTAQLRPCSFKAKIMKGRCKRSMSAPRTAVIVGFLLSLVLAGRGSGAIRAGTAKNAITPDLAARTVYLPGSGHNPLPKAVSYAL